MPSPDTAECLDMPALWMSADTAAVLYQRRFFVAKGAELVGLGLVAGLSIIPSSFASGAGPISALVVFLGVLILQVSQFARNAERRWYDARAAAESIKSASWQYAVAGEAFRRSDPNAASRFLETMHQILQSVPHLDIGPSGSTPWGPTSSMEALRAGDLRDRSITYLNQRVADQVSWYSRKAAWNKRRQQIYTGLLVVMELAAIIAGVLRVKQGVDIDLLGLAAAAAAGLVAWAESKKYGLLAESYSVTSHEVGLIASALPGVGDDGAWAQGVHDAEAAFSREHTLWQARRQGPARPG